MNIYLWHSQYNPSLWIWCNIECWRTNVWIQMDTKWIVHFRCENIFPSTVLPFSCQNLYCLVAMVSACALTTTKSPVSHWFVHSFRCETYTRRQNVVSISNAGEHWHKSERMLGSNEQTFHARFTINLIQISTLYEVLTNGPVWLAYLLCLQRTRLSFCLMHQCTEHPNRNQTTSTNRTNFPLKNVLHWVMIVDEKQKKKTGKIWSELYSFWVIYLNCVEKFQQRKNLPKTQR